MTTKNRMIERIARSKGSLKHHRKVVMTLAAVVVFVTTYSLVLPAITLDEQEAQKQPGIETEQTVNQEADSDTAKDKNGSGEDAGSDQAVSGSEETAGNQEQKDAG